MAKSITGQEMDSYWFDPKLMANWEYQYKPGSTDMNNLVRRETEKYIQAMGYNGPMVDYYYHNPGSDEPIEISNEADVSQYEVGSKANPAFADFLDKNKLSLRTGIYDNHGVNQLVDQDGNVLAADVNDQRLTASEKFFKYAPMVAAAYIVGAAALGGEGAGGAGVAGEIGAGGGALEGAGGLGAGAGGGIGGSVAEGALGAGAGGASGGLGAAGAEAGAGGLGAAGGGAGAAGGFGGAGGGSGAAGGMFGGGGGGAAGGFGGAGAGGGASTGGALGSGTYEVGGLGGSGGMSGGSLGSGTYGMGEAGGGFAEGGGMNWGNLLGKGMQTFGKGQGDSDSGNMDRQRLIAEMLRKNYEHKPDPLPGWVNMMGG